MAHPPDEQPADPSWSRRSPWAAPPNASNEDSVGPATATGGAGAGGAGAGGAGIGGAGIGGAGEAANLPVPRPPELPWAPHPLPAARQPQPPAPDSESPARRPSAQPTG